MCSCVWMCNREQCASFIPGKTGLPKTIAVFWVSSLIPLTLKAHLWGRDINPHNVWKADVNRSSYQFPFFPPMSSLLMLNFLFSPEFACVYFVQPNAACCVNDSGSIYAAPLVLLWEAVLGKRSQWVAYRRTGDGFCCHLYLGLALVFLSFNCLVYLAVVIQFKSRSTVIISSLSCGFIHVSGYLSLS